MLTNDITYTYDSNVTFSETASMFWGHKCLCAIKFHVARIIMNTLMTMVSSLKPNLCSPWDSLNFAINGTGMVLGALLKKKNMDEDFASLATCQFFGHSEDVVSHKKN